MEKSENRVIVSGLQIPFWDLVWFMVKLALASIPALFILYFVFAAVGVLLGGVMHAIVPGPLPGP